MTEKELLETLRELQVLSQDDEEVAHVKADAALLEYINDPEITDAFKQIKRWYS